MSKLAPFVVKSLDNAPVVFLGNGIHLYNPDSDALSWAGLVCELFQRLDITVPTDEQLETMIFTELVEMASIRSGMTLDKVKLVVKALINERNYAESAMLQMQLLSEIQDRRLPVISTNFDTSLNGIFPNGKKRLLQSSDHEEWLNKNWRTFFGNAPSSALGRDQIGVWQVHGNVESAASIKIASRHYVDFFGVLSDLEKKLHSARKGVPWAGASSWLDAFMNRSLLFVGFGLNPSELDIRNLLIIRYKYLRKHELLGEVKLTFLECKRHASWPSARALINALGGSFKQVADCGQIYGGPSCQT